MHFFLSIEKPICRKANDRPYLRTFIALSHPLVFDGLPQWKIVPRGHGRSPENIQLCWNFYWKYYYLGHFGDIRSMRLIDWWYMFTRKSTIGILTVNVRWTLNWYYCKKKTKSSEVEQANILNTKLLNTFFKKEQKLFLKGNILLLIICNKNTPPPINL